MFFGAFNVAKGRVHEYFGRAASGDPTNASILAVLLKTAEGGATLQKKETLAQVIAGTSEECDFTNYSRKLVTVSAPVVQHSLDRQASIMPDVTWALAGGALNNTVAMALVCYTPNSTAMTDSTIIPLTFQTTAVTTDGFDLIMAFGNTLDGYYWNEA